VHDPEIYGGRVAYFKSPGMIGKVIIFPSGKLISVGTKDEKGAFNELKGTEAFLAGKNIIEPTVLEPKIQNIVAVIDFEQSVNLEELARNSKMIYEPEQFPGGILKLDEPYKATILIFATGKAVITGARSSSQIEPLVKKIANTIEVEESRL
jgi:transcription initiation factor TFIID TATA-box-binding protein